MVLGFSVMVIQPAQAQAGLLEFFFPMLKKQEPDPGQTLRAPFAEPVEGPAVPANIPQAPKAAAPLPENSVSLEKPHRSAQQVAAWIGPVAAEVMNFDSENFKADLLANEKYFEPGARAQYLKFLEDEKILPLLQKGRTAVRSYARDVPLLLNEGAAEGRYNWLFEIPIVLSSMDKTATDYKKATAANQLFILKVQVGRSATTTDPSGMKITVWSGKSIVTNP